MTDSNELMTGYALGRDSGNNAYGDGMWGGGMWWAWIILFAIFGGWGNGFGGWGGGNGAAVQGALTRGELCQDMNFQSVENGVRGIQQGLCDGFYAVNTSLLQGFNGIENALCSVGYQTAQLANGINQNITDSRFAAQQCLMKIFNKAKKIFNYNFAVGTCAA